MVYLSAIALALAGVLPQLYEYHQLVEQGYILTPISG
jgi:hypothetical protein